VIPSVGKAQNIVDVELLRDYLCPSPRIHPVIEQAGKSTEKARAHMIRKYIKKRDIQHFDIEAIVSIKVPREDRTSTDNKRLFARILEEPYPHRYRVLTLLYNALYLRNHSEL
jgi:hypothetical protein